MQIILNHQELITLQKVNCKAVEFQSKELNSNKIFELLFKCGLLWQELNQAKKITEGGYTHKFTLTELGKQVLKNHLPFSTTKNDNINGVMHNYEL